MEQEKELTEIERLEKISIEAGSKLTKKTTKPQNYTIILKKPLKCADKLAKKHD